MTATGNPDPEYHPLDHSPDHPLTNPYPKEPTVITKSPSDLIDATPAEDLAHFSETLARVLHHADPAAGFPVVHHQAVAEWMDIQDLLVAHLAIVAECGCSQLGFDAAVACRFRRVLAAVGGTDGAAVLTGCERVSRLIEVGHVIAERELTYLPRLDPFAWDEAKWAEAITLMWGQPEAQGLVSLAPFAERISVARTLDRIVERWATSDNHGDHTPEVNDPVDLAGATHWDPESFVDSRGATILDTPDEGRLQAYTRLAATIGETEVGAQHRWLAALELALLGPEAIAARAWHVRRPMRCNDTMIDLLAEVMQ